MNISENTVEVSLSDRITGCDLMRQKSLKSQDVIYLAINGKRYSIQNLFISHA